MIEQNPKTKTAILARIIRELLKAESYDTVAGLADALKFRCAALKIAWTNEDIANALRLVESNTPLVADPLYGKLRRVQVEVIPESHSIPRDEAAKVYQEIRQRFGIKDPIKSMPELDGPVEPDPNEVEYGHDEETEYDRY